MKRSKMKSVQLLMAIPWECRAYWGWARAFYKTTWEVIFRPAEFAQQLRVRGGFWSPLLYHFGVNILIISFGLGILLSSRLFWYRHFIALGAQGIALFFILIFFLLGVLTAGIVILSLIMHGFVRLVKGSKGYYETLRVMCYSSAYVVPALLVTLGTVIALLIIAKDFSGVGIPDMLVIFLLVGVIALSFLLYLLIFFRWLVTIIEAYQEAHHLSTGKAFAAAIIPVLLVFVYHYVIISWHASRVNFSAEQQADFNQFVLELTK